MKPEDIKIRPATRSDVDFIACTVLESIDKDPDTEPEMFGCLRNLCIFDDTLYSYKFATICEVSGVVVGAVIKYPGKDYVDLRKRTLEFIYQKTGLDLTPNALETGPGEYYIDSMFVDPDYRGLGIGKKLLGYCIFSCSFPDSTLTLLVDSKAPGLQKLYSECGFRPIGEMENFGRTYIKMGRNYNDEFPNI